VSSWGNREFTSRLHLDHPYCVPLANFIADNATNGTIKDMALTQPTFDSKSEFDQCMTATQKDGLETRHASVATTQHPTTLLCRCRLDLHSTGIRVLNDMVQQYTIVVRDELLRRSLSK